MHSYDLDSDKRTKVIIILTSSSIILGYLLNKYILENLVELIIQIEVLSDIYNLLDVLGVSGLISPSLLFTALYTLFLTKAWRWKYINKWVEVPDLNGIWQGTGTSSYIRDGKNVGFDIELKVQQTFNRISFKAKFKESASYSYIAAVHTKHNTGTLIVFAYKNRSKDVNIKTKEHGGFNELVLEEPNLLTGIYYNYRESCNYGTMELVRRLDIKVTESATLT